MIPSSTTSLCSDGIYSTARKPKHTYMISSRALRDAVFIVAAGYACLWASFVVINASNMPLMDDYDAILAFVNDYSDASVGERVGLMMGQHNEHRIATTRAAAAINYHVSGTVNFTYLILVGTALWMLVCWLFIHEAACLGLPLLSLPFTALFLNLRFATLVNWAMAGLNHYTQAVFGFLCISCLCRPPERETVWSRPLGYAGLYLAVFSSGAGILVVPVVGLYLVMARRYRRLPLLGLHVVIILVLNYVVYTYRGGTALAAGFPLARALGVVQFTLYFCGNLLPAKLPCLCLGACALATLVYCASQRCDLRYPEYFFTAVLQVLVGLLAGIARIGFGPEYGMESKYSCYAILLWASLIMMGARLIRDGNWARYPEACWLSVAGMVGLSFSVSLCSWIYNRQSIENIAKVHWIVHPNEQHAREILLTSATKGIYDGRRYISNFEQKATGRSGSEAAR